MNKLTSVYHCLLVSSEEAANSALRISVREAQPGAGLLMRGSVCEEQGSVRLCWCGGATSSEGVGLHENKDWEWRVEAAGRNFSTTGFPGWNRAS